MERNLDDDVDDLPVPLDRETRRWLADLARASGAHPRELIASMLHDIRRDDERAHRYH
jgi:hypothetical protein